MATDITTTGKLSYSQLLKENLENLEGVKTSDEILLNFFSNNKAPKSTQTPSFNPVNPNLYSVNPTPVTSSLNGTWGDSMWDKQSASDAEFEDIADQRANNQSGLAQLAAGAGKMVTTAGTAFINTTLGGLYGLAKGTLNAAADAINGKDEHSFVEDLWNNEINKAMTDILNKMEEVLPNYYTLEQQNSPWYDNILSANFWGDKVLKNTGFTLGTIGAMALTGGIGAGVGGMVNMAGRGAAGVARSLGAGLGTMRNVMAGANTAGKVASFITNSAIAANGEASMEAINAVQENSEEALTNLLNRKRELLNQLDMSDPNYISKRKELVDAFSQYEEDIKASGRSVGNLVYGLNMAILSISNMFEFGHLLKGGYKQSQKLAKPHFLIEDKDATFGEALGGIIKGLNVTALNDVNKSLSKKLLLTGKNILSEAGEESGQNLASNTALLLNLAALNDTALRYKYSDGDTIIGKRINPEATEDLINYSKSFVKSLSDLFGGLEKGGWEEAFLGGLTGGAGFMTIHRAEVKDEKGNLTYDEKGKIKKKWTLAWEGGFAEAKRSVENEYDDNQRLVDSLNERFKSPEFRKRLLHTVAKMDLSSLMDEALAKGDQYTFKNSLIGALAEDYFFFRDMGLIDNLKNTYKSFTSIDDETLLQLYLASIDEEGKTELSKEEIEDIRKKYLDNAKSNLEKIEMIKDAYEYVDARFENYSDEFKYEMAYEYIKLADAKHRIQLIKENLKKQGINAKIKPISEYINEEEESTDEDIFSKDNTKYSELDEKDIERLEERVKQSKILIKQYEKHPEWLAFKLWQVKEAAKLRELGKDLEGLTKRIKEAKTLNEIDLAWRITDESLRLELWDRIWKTGDDEVRSKLAEYNFNLLALNNMSDDWKVSELPQEIKTILATYILDMYSRNNHKSDLLIEAFLKEVQNLEAGDTENSELLKVLNLDSTTNENQKIIDEIVNLLNRSVEHLKIALAKFGQWETQYELKKMMEKEEEKAQETKEKSSAKTSDSKKSKPEDEIPNFDPNEEVLEKESIFITYDYLATQSYSFRDITKLSAEDSKKVLDVIIKLMRDVKGSVSTKYNFEDFDKITANTITLYKAKGNSCDVKLAVNIFKKVTLVAGGHPDVQKWIDNKDPKHYELIMLVTEAFNKYDGTLWEEIDSQTDIKEDASEILDIPKSEDTQEEAIYNKVLEELGTNLTNTEKAALLTKVKTVLEKVNKGAKIDIEDSLIADIIEREKNPTETAITKEDSLTKLLTDTEMNCEYTIGFDVDALENYTLKYITEENTPEAEQKKNNLIGRYGSIDHWRKVLFVIDYYLNDLRDSPIKFICSNTYEKGKPYYKSIFASIKFTPEVKALFEKDNNLDNIWTVETLDGPYLIIGNLNYSGKGDTNRRNFFKKIEAELLPNEGEDTYEEEWHVGTTESKITNIGDGRVIRSTSSDKVGTHNLLDLLDPNNAEINPRRLTLKDLRFSIYYDDGHRYFGGKAKPIHSATVQTEEEDLGKVYVYLPTANGELYRRYIIPKTFNDLDADSPLMGRIREILTEIVTTKEWSRKLALLGYLRTAGSLFFNLEGSTPSVRFITKDEGVSESVLLSGTPELMVNTIIEKVLSLINPRVSISKVAFSNQEYLLMLAESGCLLIDVARINTVGANFSISINPEVTTTPKAHIASRTPANELTLVVSGNYYTVSEGTITAQNGLPIDNTTRELIDLILLCKLGSISPATLEYRSGKLIKTREGTYYFIPNGSDYRIIHENHGNWVEVNKSKKTLIDNYKTLLRKKSNTKAQLDTAFGKEVATIDTDLSVPSTAEEEKAKGLKPISTEDVYTPDEPVIPILKNTSTDILLRYRRPGLEMLVGIPGSGKSTYLSTILDPNVVIVSPDNIRLELTGNISDLSRNLDVWNVAKQRIEDAIKAGKYAILDATNTDTRYRKMFVEDMKLRVVSNFDTYATIFKADPEASKERIKKDIENKVVRSNVPTEVIDKMYEGYKASLSSLPTEGYTLVFKAEDLMFASAILKASVKKEMAKIKEGTINDGTFMLSPRGTLTHLTEEQWLYVRTKDFLSKYGNWIAHQKLIDATVIWAHPASGKTYLHNEDNPNIIDFDSVYKPRIYDLMGFLKETDAKELRRAVREERKEEYNSLLLLLFTEAILDALESGKKLLVSDILFIEQREEDLDAITTMGKDLFIERSFSKGEADDGSKDLLKEDINKALNNVTDSFKIVETDNYLKDDLNGSKLKVSLDENGEPIIQMSAIIEKSALETSKKDETKLTSTEEPEVPEALTPSENPEKSEEAIQKQREEVLIELLLRLQTIARVKKEVTENISDILDYLEMNPEKAETNSSEEILESILPYVIDNTISIDDWSVFSASLEGTDFGEVLLQKYSDRLEKETEDVFGTENTETQLQKKENTNIKDINNVNSLEVSQNNVTFVQMLTDLEADYSERLCEALAPELLDILDSVDEASIPNDIYTALHLRGITEEQYLNVKTPEQFDNLMEIIQNCRK